MTIAPDAVTRTTHVRAARAVAVDTERRVIDALVIPYGETASVSDDGGRTFYDETFEQGGATTAELVPVYGGHKGTSRGVERGPLIGVAENATETEHGIRAELTIARTAAGDEVLELARTLGRVHVSAEYELPRQYTAGETVVRSAATDGVQVDGVAVILPPHHPAFPGAAGTARADAGGDTPDDDDEDPDNPEDPDNDKDDDVDDNETARNLPELVRREVARYTTARTATTVRSPLEQYGSFRDLATAARTLPDDQAAVLSRSFHDAYHQWAEARTARALVDQTTVDNPGVVPPAWLQTVFGIIDGGRPAITALGGSRNAGSTGLELNWPYYDGDLRTLVGVQTAEKTEITSVKVSLKKGTADLRTFAGGSDVSYQLQRRSSPSYMATYQRIMTLAYALVTEDAFEDDLSAIATGAGLYDPTVADPDGAILRQFLVKASIAVKAATGTPATVALAATDAWSAIAGRPWLVAPQYGTSNVAGTSSAAGLTVDVSGLPIVEAPSLPNGQIIVTNSEAAGWHEDGPFLVTGEDVAKLGTDVAVWGLGATGVYLPGGVVDNSAPVVAATSASKSK